MEASGVSLVRKLVEIVRHATELADESGVFFGQPVYGQLIKCLNKDKTVEMSRNHGGERYIKSFDGWQHFVRRERQMVRKVL